MTIYSRCVEEAARAICATRYGPNMWHDVHKSGLDFDETGLSLWRQEAEAALSAILAVLKEPDAVMVDAGAEMCEDAYSGKAATDVWQAMLGTIKAE